MSTIVVLPSDDTEVVTGNGDTFVVVGTEGPAGPGLPMGGDEGQLPFKASDDDLDVVWRNPTKDDVGLGNVANLAPAALPISDAAQDALDLKADETSVVSRLALKADDAAVNAALALKASITQLNSTVNTAISDLLAGAGPAYDTLKELQDIITADETTASALAALVATKANKAGDVFTGSLTATGGLSDLGSTAAKWRDGFFSRNVFADSYITAGGDKAGLGGPATHGLTGVMVQTNALGGFGWGSGSTLTAASIDTALTRVSAGVVALGSGAAGGNASGEIRAQVFGAATAGSATACNFTLAGQGNLGIYFPNSATMVFVAQSQNVALVSNADFRLSKPLTFGSSTASADAGISRLGAASFAMGTSTAGDTSGTLQLKSVNAVGSATGNVPGWGNGTFGFEMFTVSNRILTRSGPAAFVGFGNTAAQALLVTGLGCMGWSGTSPDGNLDTAFSRFAAGHVALGSGAQGNFSGILSLDAVRVGNTSGSMQLGHNGSDLYLTNGGSSRATTISGDLVIVACATGASTELEMAGATAYISFTSNTTWAGVPGALTLTRDGGLSRIGPGQLAVGTGARGNDDGQLWLAYVRKKPRLVSALLTPTSGLAGLEGVVNDATAPTYNAALTGGGSVVVGARCTGTDWRAC